MRRCPWDSPGTPSAAAREGNARRATLWIPGRAGISAISVRRWEHADRGPEGFATGMWQRSVCWLASFQLIEPNATITPTPLPSRSGATRRSLASPVPPQCRWRFAAAELAVRARNGDRPERHAQMRHRFYTPGVSAGVPNSHTGRNHDVSLTKGCCNQITGIGSRATMSAGMSLHPVSWISQS